MIFVENYAKSLIFLSNIVNILDFFGGSIYNCIASMETYRSGRNENDSKSFCH